MSERGEPAIRLRQTNGQTQVFDPIRKKFVAWTPEEQVRQRLLLYLLGAGGVPQSLIAVERAFDLSAMGLPTQKRRADVLIFDRNGAPFLLAECKAPDVPLSSVVVLQAAVYNARWACPFLTLTNGVECFTLTCAASQTGELEKLPGVPPFEELLRIMGRNFEINT